MKTNLVQFHVVQRALAALAALALTTAAANATDDTLPVNITCSPSAIKLASVASGDWLTVHTDLPFASADRLSIYLDGIPVEYVKSDNRGFLVAKFSLAVFKGILQPPGAELTLTGLTVTGQPFVGTDSVRVMK